MVTRDGSRLGRSPSQVGQDFLGYFAVELVIPAEQPDPVAVIDQHRVKRVIVSL